MRSLSWAKYICLLWLLSLSVSSKAQKKYELSVQEAVEMAFKNLADVKNAQIDYHIQEAQNKGIEGQVYPQISAIASAQYYIQTPKILFPDASRAAIYDVLIKEHLLPGHTKVPVPTNKQFRFTGRGIARLVQPLLNYCFSPMYL